MNRGFVSALYVMNIVLQCIFTLLTAPSLMLLISWLLVSKLGAPTWIYAVLITLGFIVGIVSMIKFAITASEGLERLEKQRRENENKRR